MFDIKKATTAELVAEYNRLSGKSIKKFSSRAAGEKQTTALIEKALPADTVEDLPASKKGARPKAPTNRSASIRRSWSVMATHDARSARHSVEVYEEGRKEETFQGYRSTLAAFMALKLPIGQHIRFRMALKADGKNVFEHGDAKFHFAVASKKAE